jgi:hypothetical protein
MAPSRTPSNLNASQERFRKAKAALEKQQKELEKLEEDHANEQKK